MEQRDLRPDYSAHQMAAQNYIQFISKIKNISLEDANFLIVSEASRLHRRSFGYTNALFGYSSLYYSENVHHQKDQKTLYKHLLAEISFREKQLDADQNTLNHQNSTAEEISKKRKIEEDFVLKSVSDGNLTLADAAFELDLPDATHVFRLMAARDIPLYSPSEKEICEEVENFLAKGISF